MPHPFNQPPVNQPPVNQPQSTNHQSINTHVNKEKKSSHLAIVYMVNMHGQQQRRCMHIPKLPEHGVIWSQPHAVLCSNALILCCSFGRLATHKVAVVGGGQSLGEPLQGRETWGVHCMYL